MKKIIICPDSFKGTLSSEELCRIISEQLQKADPEAEIITVPVADGGEGTVEAYLSALGGEKIFCTVKSPLGRDIRAYYGLLSDNKAVIEMAQASGVTIEKENHALRCSTYGTGELIMHALSKGVRDFIIGLGGSATTDGGTGMLSALGIKFLDENGDTVTPCGEALSKIATADTSGLDKRLKECNITVLCDVVNPLYGKNGAAYVFSPQKGASEEDVRFLDEGLRNLAKVSTATLGKDYSLISGAGAAGGTGFALVAFLGAELKKGIDVLLSLTDFEKISADADLVITGEGKLDRQSLMGKVPFFVAEKSKGKRVLALVGVSEITPEEAAENGIAVIIETNPLHLPFEAIKDTAKEMLIESCKNIII